MVVGAGCSDRGDVRDLLGTRRDPCGERRHEDDETHDGPQRGPEVLVDIDPVEADDGRDEGDRHSEDDDGHELAGLSGEVVTRHVHDAETDEGRGDDDERDATEAGQTSEHVAERVESREGVERVGERVVAQDERRDDRDERQGGDPVDDEPLDGVSKHCSAPSPLGI